MRIIGCGNRHRGDDAAGILAVERLFARGIAAELCAGEPSELIEAWRAAEDVVVIDAVVTGAPVGTIHVWDAAQPPVFITSAASTHGLGLAQAIELARVMNSLPPRLRIYGIEGECFETGATVSPDVDRAVEEVVRRVAAETALPSGGAAL